MAFYGVQLGKSFPCILIFSADVLVRELNLKFKLAIQQKGGVGIRSLRRIFNQMDFNGNKRLDAGEFEQALAAFGIFPKKVEL